MVFMTVSLHCFQYYLVFFIIIIIGGITFATSSPQKVKKYGACVTSFARTC